MLPTRMMKLTAAIVLSLGAACGFTHGAASQRDGGPGGGGSDAGSATARTQVDVVSGGGRVHAGTTTIDVEIGHGVLVRKSTAGTKTIAGNPAVKP